MLASCPVTSLNHKSSDSGIPSRFSKDRSRSRHALFTPRNLCNMRALRGWADSTQLWVENRPIAGENRKIGRDDGASLEACLQG